MFTYRFTASMLNGGQVTKTVEADSRRAALPVFQDAMRVDGYAPSSYIASAATVVKPISMRNMRDLDKVMGW